MRSRVLTPGSIIRVQNWDAQASAPLMLEQWLGAPWPHQVGAVASGRAVVLCLGSTDWLAIAPESEASTLRQQLQEACDDSSYRATNVSQALTRIEIQGPAARELFQKGCGLDLHTSHFPPGRCARTRFVSLPLVIRCTDPTTFECIIASSYCDYLLYWLADATEETYQPV